ncbi:MAG TPA: YciI family protein, partial [Anaerolineales bacterium]|nr:YciI family protein [Anaerolineales bacterium]
RFIYFYFNRNEPEKIHQVVPAHVEYWRSLNMEGYMGGPFTDRTGGLISFLDSNLEEAEEIMRQDPFVSADLIEQKWIKQWIVESHAAA